MEHLVLEIEKRLEGLTKGGFFTLVKVFNVMGEDRIKFAIATSNKCIHNVQGQMPDLISFTLTKDLVLQPQIFGGSGGGYILRNIDPNEPKERYLACKGEKIPFRKPQQTEKAVLAAIERLTVNYYETLMAVKKRGLLRYAEYSDYEKLLY